MPQDKIAAIEQLDSEIAAQQQDDRYLRGRSGALIVIGTTWWAAFESSSDTLERLDHNLADFE